jgi:hypothetical protein
VHHQSLSLSLSFSLSALFTDWFPLKPSGLQQQLCNPPSGTKSSQSETLSCRVPATMIISHGLCMRCPVINQSGQENAIFELILVTSSVPELGRSPNKVARVRRQGFPQKCGCMLGRDRNSCRWTAVAWDK